MRIVWPGGAGRRRRRLGAAARLAPRLQPAAEAQQPAPQDQLEEPSESPY